MHRTIQQDIAEARAYLSAPTEDMRAYCAHVDRNGDWADADDLELRVIIMSWLADMEAA